eukprot:4535847-Ditylum_brightwellii.AAC.1
MVQYTPDKIKAKFPHPSLQTIEEEPDYATINVITLQLYENAAVTLSSLGRGAHGHIALVMEPTLYSSLLTTAYTAPPTPTRTTMPGNASAQARYNEDNGYKNELDTYENHIAMDDVLKKQVQEAVDDVYMCQLRQKYSAYLGITTRDILDHLMDIYEHIKPADLVASGARYNEPMDITQPIDVYFVCIDDCIQYASDGKCYTLPNRSLLPHSMLYKGQVGLRKESDHGRQEMLSIKYGKTLKRTLQQNMMKLKKNKG